MKIFIVILFLCLVGCAGPVSKEVKGDSVIINNSQGAASVTKVTIDGHSYIVAVGAYKLAICQAKED